jgi:hypothetical protein
MFNNPFSNEKNESKLGFTWHSDAAAEDSFNPERKQLERLIHVRTKRRTLKIVLL